MLFFDERSFAEFAILPKVYIIDKPSLIYRETSLVKCQTLENRESISIDTLAETI